MASINDAVAVIHCETGPGPTETFYKSCLTHELRLRGMIFRQNIPFQIRYKDFLTGKKLHIGILVEDAVAIIVMAGTSGKPVEEALMKTLLRSEMAEAVMLFNFALPALASGYRKMLLS